MKKIARWIIILVVFLTTTLSFSASATAQTYKIATDTTYAPFEWTDENGQLTGIDIDIMRAIAQNQGFDIEFQVLGFNAALQALESGQVDGVIAGMSITSARQQKFAMSTSYFEDSGLVIAVNPQSSIQKLEDLTGQKVAVKIGTNGAKKAEEYAKQYNFELTTFEDSANMYQDVISGNSVAVFEDSAPMSYAIAQGVPLKVVSIGSNGATYGFASLKTNQDNLTEKFNKGLENIKADGTYAKIINKYFEGTDLAVDTQTDTSIIGIVKTNGLALLSGLGQTVLLTLSAITIAGILGVVLGLFSVSKHKGLTLIYTIYVDIMRGTPLMVLAFFIYFALPQLFHFQYTSAFLPSLLTLSLNAAAFIGELFRGGINAVDKGQFEASFSLGIPYVVTMKKVILPQAIKLMIPPFINQFVMTLKDTSILSVIGLVELTQTGRLIIARTYASTNTWIIVAVMYIVLITCLTKMSKVIENKWQ